MSPRTHLCSLPTEGVSVSFEAARQEVAPRKNWIAVACAAHARRGCAVPAQGYMQVCHGKCAPLKRVAPGDRVAYYSPTVSMGGKDKLQAFVSIGIVLPGAPYAHRDAGPPQGAIATLGGMPGTGGGFAPYRRDVAYVPALEAPILPLLDDFEFVEDRSRWGYKFRFGLFQVSDADMLHIAHAMRAAPELLYL